MIALQSLLVVACLAVASYTLSILLLYKNKDRLGKTKGPTAGKRLPVADTSLANTKTKRIMK